MKLKVALSALAILPLFGFFLQKTNTHDPVINILITLDDAGIRDFAPFAAVYDSTSLHQTPNFNGFVGAGVLMTKFATLEKCGPTRDQIRNPYPLRLSGREGVNLDASDLRVGTRKGASLAEIALQNNVFTAYLGKWHLGTFANKTSMTYGYSFAFLAGVSAFYQTQAELQPNDLRWNGLKQFWPNVSTKTVIRQTTPTSPLKRRTFPYSENREKTVTDTAIMLLDRFAMANHDVFIDLNYTTGHTPNEFELDEVVQQLDLLFGLGTNVHNYTAAQRLIAIRKAQFEFWDGQFGRLWSKIQQLEGQGKKINILFFSDNPASNNYEEYNRPLTLKKGSYGSSIFNMAVFYSTYLPTITGNYDHLVTVMDVYPTMVELMGIRKKIPAYGKSILPAIQSGAQLHEDWDVVPLSVALPPVQSVIVEVGGTIYQESTSTQTTNQNNPASDSLVFNINTDYFWLNNLNMSATGMRLHDSLLHYRNNAPPQEINTVPPPSWYDDVNYFIGEYPQNHHW